MIQLAHKKALLFSLFFSLLFVVALPAQTIKGYVYDKETLEPMQGVTIYFDGTSIGTVSNIEGYFELTTKTKVTATLIVSYIGYYSEHIDDPYKAKIFKVYLSEKSFDLEEVVLQADPFSREAKLAVFKREFLGEGYEGVCEIKNVDAVTVTFNMKSSKLLAYASQPLKIINKDLGYEITYNLVKFEATYTQNTLYRSYLKGVFYSGSSFFLDTSKGAGKYARRRKKLYYGSVLHFIRSLASETLTEQKFGMFKNRFQVNPKDYFTVKDSLNIKFISTTQPKWDILYKKDKQSALEVDKSGFFVDTYGNFTPSNALVFGGYIGRMRFKETLPLDYRPK
ncbi:hypothetical protein NBRC110019_17290 [Neptunitalea chrysea]|uniref:Carboxypeptidase-like regulatory domain-containing protein n=1 Tax=Neptunitalea chrysea TaxID=1647581 RepID=A0A9W6B518_9FLAO|nr:carboxypeptidase-like regulatory domain-containing protein [Neptunitalea chrysea]GLB52689.1 hypothetical protein NBRC110019_17290 [Neptunitalea chrysea]